MWAAPQARERFLPRCASRAGDATCPCASSRKGGGHGLAAGLGGALRDGPARLPGDQRAATSPPPSARAWSTKRSWRTPRSASPSRATRHFVLANPALRADARLAAGRPARPARAARSGPATPTTRRSAAIGPGAGARRVGRDSSAQPRAATAARFLAPRAGRAVDPRHPADGGTIWIVEDITERRRSSRRWPRARDAAEAASRAKSAFLANTSHEIRTPLNGLLGLARLAREPRRRDRSAAQYLDQIVDSAEALSAVISDILDLSKIEAGKLALEASAVRPAATLLRTLRQSTRTLAEARGLDAAAATSPTACRRWCAATRCACARSSATSWATR